MYKHFITAFNVLSLSDQLSSTQPVVDDESEDKVQEDALKKLGLLRTCCF